MMECKIPETPDWKSSRLIIILRHIGRNVGRNQDGEEDVKILNQSHADGCILFEKLCLVLNIKQIIWHVFNLAPISYYLLVYWSEVKDCWAVLLASAVKLGKGQERATRDKPS